MGNLRKVIASISLVAILSTFAVTNAAFAKSPFTDVPDSHWFTTEGWDVKAKDAGIFTNTTAMPDASVIRADMAKMIAAAAGLNMTSLEAFPSGVFTDVKSTDYWYKPLQAARQANVFTEKPKFDSAGLTNRAQAAKIIVSAFGLTPATPKTKTFTDVNLSYTGADAWMNNIYTAYCYGVVKGGTFNPAKPISRGEVAKMLIVAKDAPTLKAECTPGTPVDPTNPPVVTGGDLEVSVNADTSTDGPVPSQASGVPFASFDLTAGSNGALVDQIVVTRKGVTTNSSFDGVYLYDQEGTRLTSKKTLNSETNQATFSNLDVTIPANDTLTVTVKADMANLTASGEAKFEITAAADVSIDGGDVTGDFPVSGESLSVSTTDAGSVIVTKSGTVSNPTIGQQGAKIGEFKIAVSTEDALIEQLAVTVDGGIDMSGVKNLELKDQSGDVVASVEGLTGQDLAIFNFDEPYKIVDGANRIFRVYADVTGTTGDDVRAYFDSDADVLAIGGDYGFGLSVDRSTSGTYDGTTCTSSAGKCSWSELEGGDLTFAFNGPLTSDVSVGADDVTLLKFSLTAGEATDVKGLNFFMYADDDDNDPFDGTDDAGADTDGLIFSDDATANFTNLKVINVDTGKTVMGPVELDVTTGNDATQTLTYTDDFTVAGGATLNLALVSTVDPDTAAGVEFAATLDISSFDAEDANGDTVATSAIVPSTDMVGNTMTTVASGLTTSLAGTPVSDEFVKGTSDVSMVGINFHPTDSSDVTVTQVSFTGYVDEDNNGTYGETGEAVQDFVSSVSIYAVNAAGVSEKIAGPKSVSATGVVEFSDISWTIAAGDTKKLTVKADLAKPSTVSNDEVYFKMLAASVVAQDEEGDSVDASDNINATPSVVVTVKDSGTLSFTEEGGPDSKLLVAGTTSQLVSKYKFQAVDEAFTVKKLNLFTETSGHATTSADTTYTRAYDAVTIKFKDVAGAEVTKTADFASGVATFSNLTFYVPKDGSAYIEIYTDLNTTTGGTVTGDPVRIAIDENTATANNNIEAVSAGSNQTLKADSSSLTFPTNETDVATHIVRRTTPTVKLASGLSTALSAGTVELYGVSIKANAAQAVAVKGFNFKMTGSFSADADGFSSFKLYRGTTDVTDDVSIIASAVADGGISNGTNLESIAQADFVDAGLTYDLMVMVTFNDSTTSEEVVSAGAEEIYYLKASAGGVNSSSDSVSVYIPDDANNVTRIPAVLKAANIKFVGGTVTDTEAGENVDGVIYDLFGDSTASDGAVCANSADDITLGGTVSDCAVLGEVTASKLKFISATTAGGGGSEATASGVVYDLGTADVASDGNACTNAGSDITLGGTVSDCGLVSAITATNLFIGVDAGAADNLIYDRAADKSPSNGAVCSDTDGGDIALGGTAAADCEAVISTGTPLFTYGLLWSDNYSTSHATTTADWTNGNLVDSLDTATLTKSF